MSAKEVTICSAYGVGANLEMDCYGNYNQKDSIVGLYKKGWHYAGDISGLNKITLVFEK